MASLLSGSVSHCSYENNVKGKAKHAPLRIKKNARHRCHFCTAVSLQCQPQLNKVNRTCRSSDVADSSTEFFPSTVQNANRSPNQHQIPVAFFFYFKRTHQSIPGIQMGRKAVKLPGKCNWKALSLL